MEDETETIKRLVQGREAKQLLENPLMVGFFSSHLKACQEAFRKLPMGCTIEHYQTIQHDLLAIERLRISLESYIRQAETDAYNQKRMDEIPEHLEV